MDNQFSIRAMFDEWAGSDVVVTLSTGLLEIIHPDIFMLNNGYGRLAARSKTAKNY
jgi:hypothetical protein